MTPPTGVPVLPAPAAMLGALRLVAAVVYAVPQSLAIGWPVLTLVAEGVGHGAGDTSMRRLAVWLARRTPGAIVMTMVLAFPPFLLDLVLHGSAILPAAQHLGWAWLAATPLMFIGLGASFWVALRRRGTEPSTIRPFLPDIVESYLLAFRRRGLERPGLALTLVALAALLGTGIIFTAHGVLLTRPALWAPAAGIPNGWKFPLGDPELLPRLVTILVGALAVAGLSVGWHGADRLADGEAGYGRTATRFGILWFGVATGLLAVTWPWWLMALPAPLRLAALSGPGPFWCWVGGGAAGVAVLLAIVAVAAPEPRQYIVGAAVAQVISLVGFAALRQRLREAALAGWDPGAVTTVTHSGPAVLFAVTAVLAAAALAYLVLSSAPSRRGT